MTTSKRLGLVSILVGIVSVGCAHEPKKPTIAPAEQPSTTRVTSAPVEQKMEPVSPSLSVSEDIARA